MGRCVPGGKGPMCHWWNAKAVSINDGDTIGVRLDGDRSRRVYQVRFLGLQAMELTRHNDSHPSKRRGQCRSNARDIAIAATNRVTQLLKGSHYRVRLSAKYPSSRSGGRLARFIAVDVHGHWEDMGLILMTEGKTIFMAGGREWAWNDIYNAAGQQAALQHLGIWDPAHCDVGPSQSVPIKVWADWNPPGPDNRNLDGEWIKVQNQSLTESLPLTGWWVRDSMLHLYHFSAGTVLAPGATITVHTGHGTDTQDDRYWGLNFTLFPNIDNVGLGDGAYLFDPQGDLRGSMVYPCLAGCTDPAQGAIRVIAQPRGNEAVYVRNVSLAPVALDGYVLMVPGAMLPFRTGTVLQPGETMTFDLGGSSGADTASVHHLGLPARQLPDSGGWVAVSTYDDTTVDCDAWGHGRCGVY
jgi:endonuclease YncB( thermonuclease family)